MKLPLVRSQIAICWNCKHCIKMTEIKALVERSDEV